ncbi:MAG: hypothetical protein R2879_16000 [Saprospiraceae bacterium]
MSEKFKRGDDTRPLFFHLNWNQRIRAWVLATIIFFLIISYVFEFARFENILNFKSLILWSVMIIGIAAAYFSWIFAKGEKTNLDKIRAFLIIFITTIIFAPLLGSLSNRYFSYKKTYLKAFEIFEVSRRSQPQKSLSDPIYDYDVFIFYKNHPEKISLKSVSQELKKGDTVTLELTEGFWGFIWVNPESIK